MFDTHPIRRPTLETSRRNFLSQSAGALGLLFLHSLTPELLAQAHQHARTLATGTAGKTFTFLTPEEAADFDAFAAQIVPSDGTPGAREAGAVYFADYMLTNLNPEQQKDFRGALATLRNAAQAQPGAASFAALPVEKQLDVMKRMDKPMPSDTTAGADPTAANAAAAGAAEAQAFGALRFIVLAGTFCDPSLGGNRSQIGWKLLGYDDQAYWAPPFGYYDAHTEETA
jgi:hypothetical protein